ncbi:MAG TPA: acyl-CoA dehydrogenase family protein [Acidimicrobiales bacterium]|nr:acyl-CoA dehydrogenase family protein [Acidimicrobiales bacterium]
MHFAFDENQLEFRAQLRAFAEKQCTPGDIREAWDSRLGWSRPRWSALAEMGVVGITVPEEFGGMGLGLVDAVALLEEAGRAGLPEPLVETIVLGVPVLADAPGQQGSVLRSRWLSGVADGGVRIAVGMSSMPAVPGAEEAELLLLERDGELHAVPGAAVALTARPALDGSRRLARVEWEPSPSTLVVSGFEAEEVLAALGDRAAMGVGAVLVGVADRLIAMAAQYAKDRVQFGKPIGSFQAVKHHLADALVRVEFARPMVYRAALSLSEGDRDASLHASMAKAMASDAATLAARTALQVHGAIGYTWEHDLHLWMKRAWALSAAWGDAVTHRSRVLEILLARRP